MSPTDGEMIVLSVEDLGVVDENGGCGNFIGRRRFPSLSYLAGDKLLKLASELFPLPRCSPESAVCRGGVFWSWRFEVDRGYFVDDIQRAGIG